VNARLPYDLTPREAGEHAAIACMAKAEAVSNFDSEAVRRLIVLALKRRGQMSGEALVNLAKAAGYTPHDDRAYGSVFSTLSRRGAIRCVGYCERKKGHSTAGGRLWQAA
jgi:hypothetical protein